MKTKLYEFDIRYNRKFWNESGIKDSLMLTREAFCERALTNALYFDCKQIIEFTMDSAPIMECVNPEFQYINAQISDTSWHNKIDKTIDSFGFMFNIVSKIPEDQFVYILQKLANVYTEGSSIVFDYETDVYEYKKLEEILSKSGFRIYEHLNAKEAEVDLFYRHNLIHSKVQITPPEGVCYCLAVRK